FDWYPGKTLYYQKLDADDIFIHAILGESIDSVQLLDGKYYQCVKNNEGEAQLIRGIGHIKGFFYSNFWPPLDGSLNDLLCFYIDDILVYSNPNFNYCETVSIAEIEQNLEINIYPNPTTGELKIDASNSLSAGNEELIIENIEIFDITGKEKKFFIKSSASMSNIVIDISHLPAGIYYLRLNKTITKIIKL
ncbi:T9SS type A sorting domain-containing protein, partial [Bacteroidales bacterium OttesenSCG-928-K03]|nr:T9SS type A sorting domain-containing protein [Bacteroidales bacterium OttesenSCG-928-K03]